MALDYSALKNVEPLSINVSRLGAGEEIPENIKNYIADNGGSFWINFTSFGFFIVLFTYFMIKKQYTVSQSLLMSSLWSLVVVFGFLITGFSKEIYPLFFYGTLAFISWVWMYTQKKKGLQG